MTDARARIHAMFPLDEAATAELDARLDAHHTEAFTEGARLIEDAACDADWNKPADYCRGLRAGAELLLAKTTEAGGAVAAHDFFRPGHAYTHRNGTDFKCVAVTTHPQTGEQLAMGWHVDSWTLHYPTTVGINQWNHEYDGVQPPASTEGGSRG